MTFMRHLMFSESNDIEASNVSNVDETDSMLSTNSTSAKKRHRVVKIIKKIKKGNGKNNKSTFLIFDKKCMVFYNYYFLGLVKLIDKLL
jgi:hypothetical protein